jgi:hypothetical protein
MKIPDNLTAIEWVHIHEVRSDRLILDIANTYSWYGYYPQAICLAMDTGLNISDIDWLQRICLWFASIRTCMNDSLLLESNRLFLVRRYSEQQNIPQWEASLTQQLAITDWLSRQGSTDIQPRAKEEQ